jgi:hypothetical protein
MVYGSGIPSTETSFHLKSFLCVQIQVSICTYGVYISTCMCVYSFHLKSILFIPIKNFYMCVCVGRNLYIYVSTKTIQSVFQTAFYLKRYQIDDFMCF